MGKENVLEKVGSALDGVLQAIRKEFGEMSILRLGDEARKDIEAVSTGALLWSCLIWRAVKPSSECISRM